MSQATNPYLQGLQQVGSTYSPFFTPGHMMPTLVGPDPNVGSPLGVVPQTIVPQKMPRSDRLEVSRVPVWRPNLHVTMTEDVSCY